MPHETFGCHRCAIRDGRVPYAMQASPPPSNESLLARIERAAPAASMTTSCWASSASTSTSRRSLPWGACANSSMTPTTRSVLGTSSSCPPRTAPACMRGPCTKLHARWMAKTRLRRDGESLTSLAHTRRYIEARLRGLRNEVFGGFTSTTVTSRSSPSTYSRAPSSSTAPPCIPGSSFASDDAERRCSHRVPLSIRDRRARIAAPTAPSPSASPRRSHSLTFASSTTSSSVTGKSYGLPSAAGCSLDSPCLAVQPAIRWRESSTHEPVPHRLHTARSDRQFDREFVLSLGRIRGSVTPCSSYPCR